ncbi:MAG: hypothetical protein M3340_18310 [Actinomycetota bacterium]|nr:hypothetical protein [Actinomycetota bacterium]
MPSIDDVFSELQSANGRLQQIHDRIVALTNSTDAVKASTDQVNNTLQTGFAEVNANLQTLVALTAYADKALLHVTKQNDTIICELAKISHNTCGIHNETHVQTGLQRALAKDGHRLLRISEHAEADATLAVDRLEKVEAEMRECCPPEEEPPVCEDRPCPKPAELKEEPPQVTQRPTGGRRKPKDPH